MDLLTVERVGGLAAFGGPAERIRIRSRGQIRLADLSKADRHAVEAFFQPGWKARPSADRDGFEYRLSMSTRSGEKTVQVPEAEVPAALITCVKDELT